MKLRNKLTDHNHDKYITSPEFNTLSAGVFDARLAEENLVTGTEFFNKLKSLNKNINSNKWKSLLVENTFKKLKIFDSSYLSYFEEDGTHNYLVFEPMGRCF